MLIALIMLAVLALVAVVICTSHRRLVPYANKDAASEQPTAGAPKDVIADLYALRIEMYNSSGDGAEFAGKYVDDMLYYAQNGKDRDKLGADYVQRTRDEARAFLR